ncbi:MAG: hypothetical protein AB8C02_04235 [Halioglobus sp.]
MSDSSSDPAGRPGSGRMVLLLIGGVPVTIVLAATWLWYFGTSGNFDVVGALGTGNRGQLVQPPRQMDEYTLSENGTPATRITWSELEPRWTMLVPNSGAGCEKACEKSLYLTRQIHTAMGKEFNRLRRIYVGTVAAENAQLQVAMLEDGRPAPAATFAQFLAGEHRGLKALVVKSSDFAVLYPELVANPSTWYLVDPRGWVMMAYNSDIPYKDVISDLKFLLKNSSG